MPSTAEPRQRLIVVLAFERAQLLDLSGPVQTFAAPMRSSRSLAASRPTASLSCPGAAARFAPRRGCRW